MFREVRRKNNKPGIYLISPATINENFFFNKFKNLISSGLIDIFQLRVKNYSDREIIDYSKKLLPICKNYNVVFILNDRPDLAKLIEADGVHLGRQDMSIKDAREILGRQKIIGSSCYNNISQSIKSEYLGANYIAYGAFFKTETKENTTNINIYNIKKYKKNIKSPIVAIGGLNRFNIKKLSCLKPEFLAFCSAIWYNKMTPLEETNKINNIINKTF